MRRTVSAEVRAILPPGKSDSHIPIIPVYQDLEYTSQVTNPTERDSAVKKVVSAARAILADQIGLSAGCQRLNKALSWLAPYETNLPTVTNEYMKAVVGLPIGSERLCWDREALRQKDIVLESVNQNFRSRILETCWVLIDRFGESKHV